MTRILNRGWIVALAAGIAGLLWSERQGGIRDARSDLASARAKQALIRDRIDHAQGEIESSQDELSQQQDWRSAATNRIAQLEAQMSRTAPASRWADPPAAWPGWDTNSPYVWLRKGMFSELRIKRFNDRGEMTSEIAGVLGLSPAETAALNSSLAQIVATHQAAQLARVQKSESDSVDGERTLTVTVPPSPQDGAAQAQLFQAALEDQLGAQRAGLIDEDTNWFESEFDLNLADTNTYTITMHSNGEFSLRMAEGRNGSSYYSGGNYASTVAHLPPYLTPVLSSFAQTR
jgi:hypothetical protein